jgi:ectoine hydroxylase-related dioxygenase (phytanoyl-CoA dioxygenase family)
MIHLAQEVLGAGAFPFRATLFDKSPTANWLVVWHQDTALPLRARIETPGWGPWSVKDGVPYAHAPTAALSKVLALRVHLDDSGTKNGPLRVLPGTHALGVQSDDRVHEVAARIAPIDCVAAKGAVVAMRPLIIHASSKSHEETPRRVLHIEYAASDSVEQPLQLAIA